MLLKNITGSRYLKKWKQDIAPFSPKPERKLDRFSKFKEGEDLNRPRTIIQ
jgi:hypothetical protein